MENNKMCNAQKTLPFIIWKLGSAYKIPYLKMYYEKNYYKKCILLFYSKSSKNSIAMHLSLKLNRYIM